MRHFASALFARSRPVLSQAGTADAREMAELHAASFHRGWNEADFADLLAQRHVVAHCAKTGAALVGFVLSRIAAGEAEILSIAVAASRRSRGIASQLLELHLRRLASLGVQTVFLEVAEQNAPARRLYDRAQFHQVGRREAYYADARGSAAILLRRNLA
jgi:ribosomal-protein-alanine N-acetyltransferase